MSVLSRPFIAATVARMLQSATRLAGRRMEESARSRLPEFSASTEVIEVPTSVGPARVTVYRSDGVGSDAAVHVNLHGGGYVLDIAELDDPVCRILAVCSGSVVLNVEYLVAPSHPFPAPTTQVFEVVRWAAEQGDERGWDGDRLTVGGQSAGGGLAAAAARQALEQHGPTILLQVLHYPPLDLSTPASAKSSVVAKPVLRPWMGEVYDTSYAPDPATRKNPLISPAGGADTADLTGIAPALIIAAEHDILRAEARRYADRVDDVGALVEYLEVSGADHGYDVMDDDRARESYRFVARHIRNATAR